jgi:hypothetical protein
MTNLLDGKRFSHHDEQKLRIPNESVSYEVLLGTIKEC